MNTPKTYYVYILGSRDGTLYIGVSNDLERRLYEHKSKGADSFTKRYDVNRLLFFEAYPRRDDAIEAEKRLKGWTRKRKLTLIRTQNQKFVDLSKDWLGD